MNSTADLGLGSTNPAMVGERVLVVGKRGVGYLLDTARLGGIGGQLTRAPICPALGAGAVWVTDTTRGILYALNPETGTPVPRST